MANPNTVRLFASQGSLHILEGKKAGTAIVHVHQECRSQFCGMPGSEVRQMLVDKQYMLRPIPTEHTQYVTGEMIMEMIQCIVRKKIAPYNFKLCRACAYKMNMASTGKKVILGRITAPKFSSVEQYDDVLPRSNKRGRKTQYVNTTTTAPTDRLEPTLLARTMQIARPQREEEVPDYDMAPVAEVFDGEEEYMAIDGDNHDVDNHDVEEITEKTVATRCQGVTKAGAQCKRKVSNGQYCVQHGA